MAHTYAEIVLTLHAGRVGAGEQEGHEATPFRQTTRQPSTCGRLPTRASRLTRTTRRTSSLVRCWGRAGPERVPTMAHRGLHGEGHWVQRRRCGGWACAAYLASLHGPVTPQTSGRCSAHTSTQEGARAARGKGGPVRWGRLSEGFPGQLVVFCTN